jgi:alpha-glucan,water dikinase
MLATGNRDEMYVEVVRGLGEALVGNWPGSALSFTAMKSQLPGDKDVQQAAEQVPGGCLQVKGYPSKSHALLLAERPEGDPVTIFRSDSNGEDLEGCAPCMTAS